MDGNGLPYPFNENEQYYKKDGSIPITPLLDFNQTTAEVTPSRCDYAGFVPATVEEFHELWKTANL